MFPSIDLNPKLLSPSDSLLVHPDAERCSPSTSSEGMRSFGSLSFSSALGASLDGPRGSHGPSAVKSCFIRGRGAGESL